jgi:hypothetical protein
VRALVVLVVAAAAAAAPREARAAPDGVAPVSSAVVDPLDAVELVRAGDFARAVEVAAPGRAALTADPRASDDKIRRLGLVYAVARAAAFLADRRGDEGEVTRLLAQAGARARPEDLPLLRALEHGSPRAAPYARAVARRAVAQIGPERDPRALVALLHSVDAAARRRALAALGERLARFHEQIEAGGELASDDQRALADPELVAALVSELGERAAVLDQLPHDLAAEASPSALHALALVETPALAALEAAKRNGVAGADAALAAVTEAALARLRRHPRSSWSSARGTLPALVPGASVCASCHRPLPLGARFCPSCGGDTPLAACARCGGLVTHGLCARCGGSGQGDGRRCPNEKCQEALGAMEKFCHRCGTPLP